MLKLSLSLNTQIIKKQVNHPLIPSMSCTLVLRDQHSGCHRQFQSILQGSNLQEAAIWRLTADISPWSTQQKKPTILVILIRSFQIHNSLTAKDDTKASLLNKRGNEFRHSNTTCSKSKN